MWGHTCSLARARVNCQVDGSDGMAQTNTARHRNAFRGRDEPRNNNEPLLGNLYPAVLDLSAVCVPCLNSSISPSTSHQLSQNGRTRTSRN